MRFLKDHNKLCDNCPAVSACVFFAFSKDDRRKMTEKLRFFSYRDEETIFNQGERVRGLSILCQGLVKIRFITQEGRDLLIGFCRPGALLNGIAAKEHAFSAVSVGTSTVGFITRTKAMDIIKQHPKLGLEIERRFSQDGQLLLQRMADLAYDSIEERLAHVLLSLGRRHGVHEEDNLRIDLPLSQQDLAEMIGASRQAVNRELRKLADHGLIHMERCRITILSEQGLQNLK